MAKDEVDEKDLNEDDDDLNLGDEKAPGKKKLIIIIAGAFLLINIAIGAYLFLFAGGEEGEGVVEGEEVAQEAEAEEEDDGRPIFYHEINDLVVNLESKPSLLQIGLQVRIRGEEIADFLAHNDPMIRHEFLNILGAQDGTKLKKRANKEALQKQLLDKLRQIAAEQGSPEPDKSIEAIYFVAFVTQ